MARRFDQLACGEAAVGQVGEGPQGAFYPQVVGVAGGHAGEELRFLAEDDATEIVGGVLEPGVGRLHAFGGDVQELVGVGGDVMVEDVSVRKRFAGDQHFVVAFAMGRFTRWIGPALFVDVDREVVGEIEVLLAAVPPDGSGGILGPDLLHAPAAGATGGELEIARGVGF